MNPLESRVQKLEQELAQLKRFISFDTNTVTIYGSLAVKGLINMQGAIITTGTGSPEGVVTATIGSIYLRRNGTGSNTLYVKESGTASTGWSTTA